MDCQKIDIKFHENLSSGSQVIPSRHAGRQTDMMKLIVNFCIFADTPKNGLGLDQLLLM